MDRKRVVILGASDKPERYSNRALKLLVKDGNEVVPVHPTLDGIEGIPVVHALSDVGHRPDVLTVYVNPSVSSGIADQIARLSPRTVIFNPGTENSALESRLKAEGVRIVHACTVTLLTTGRFAKGALSDGSRHD